MTVSEIMEKAEVVIAINDGGRRIGTEPTPTREARLPDPAALAFQIWQCSPFSSGYGRMIEKGGMGLSQLPPVKLAFQTQRRLPSRSGGARLSVLVVARMIEEGELGRSQLPPVKLAFQTQRPSRSSSARLSVLVVELAFSSDRQASLPFRSCSRCSSGRRRRA
ncbi:uncharacterized protein DS421_18g619000 [Arachis hypogaea]|nr:uncharacterized protein DS421_18g619000 [Arachis hypogaea]